MQELPPSGHRHGLECLEANKLPLTTWFVASYFESQAKTGIASLVLRSRLGVKHCRQESVARVAESL